MIIDASVNELCAKDKEKVVKREMFQKKGVAQVLGKTLSAAEDYKNFEKM